MSFLMNTSGVQMIVDRYQGDALAEAQGRRTAKLVASSTAAVEPFRRALAAARRSIRLIPRWAGGLTGGRT